ncbi:MAG: TonB family protein [bacterium]|nr:TonB family protein [bacterium]
MKRICIALFLFFSAILPFSVHAQYRQIDYAPPAELGPGVKDSILRATLPPIPTYPAKGKKAQVRAAVWLKVTVGELGEVKAAEVVRCVTPGYGFEEAALKAVRDAYFEPLWDGIYPVEYVGYCPVVYANPNAIGMEWTDEAGRRRVGKGARVIGPGIDAPIVEPLTPPVLNYPREAISNLVEAVVLTRLKIDKTGHPIDVEVKNVSVPGYHFREIATKAVRSTPFPVKLNSKGNPVGYDAYYRVYFNLTAETMALVGIPLPTDSVPGLVRPQASPNTERRFLRETFESKREGTALINAYVDTLGLPKVIQLATSAGDPILDTNAIVEVRNMRFEPGRVDGRKVGAWTTVSLNYKLSQLALGGLTWYEESSTTDSANITHCDTLFDTTTANQMLIVDSIGSTKPGSTSYADLVPPEYSAKFTRYKKAQYPLEDWSNGTEGWVKLAAVIDEKGRVLDTTIASSSGNSRFEKAAIKAISGHKFAPGTTNGKPVTSWMAWFVRFDSTSKDVERPGPKELIAPKPLEVTNPTYPETAVSDRSTGSVWVRLYVDTTGRVLETKLLETSGDPALDSAALAVAPTYRFTPALYNGQPQRFWMKYEVRFSIQPK